jgi:hypothetical protein
MYTEKSNRTYWLDVFRWMDLGSYIRTAFIRPQRKKTSFPLVNVGTWHILRGDHFVNKLIINNRDAILFGNDISWKSLSGLPLCHGICSNSLADSCRHNLASFKHMYHTLLLHLFLLHIKILAWFSTYRLGPECSNSYSHSIFPWIPQILDITT